MKKLTLLTLFCLSLTLYSNAQTGSPTNATAASDEKIFQEVEQMPQYAGGEQGMWKFITSNVKYPATQSTAYVSFIIETDGHTSGHKIIRGDDTGLNEEALRVTRLLTFEKPGKQNGKAVRVQYTLPIKVNLY
jgi:protein TonB